MTRRQALSADEEAAWTNLHLISQCLPAVMNQQLRRDAGLGHYDYAVLLTLYRTSEHTAPLIDLSAITSGSYSRLSHTISRLEERGLVTRERRGANRYASLTEEGRRTFISAASAHVSEIRKRVLNHVPADKIADLAELLHPIAEQLRAATPRE